MQPGQTMKSLQTAGLKAGNESCFNPRSQEAKASQDINDEEDRPFNGCEWMMLSYRLARRLPDHPMSKIILNFHSTMPPHLMLKQQSLKDVYSSHFSFLTSSATVILVYLMQQLLTMNTSIQDIILHETCTVMAVVIMSWFIQLYKMSPVLVLIPIVIAAALIHFLVQATKRSSSSELAKISPAPIHNETKSAAALSPGGSRSVSGHVEGLQIGTQGKRRSIFSSDSEEGVEGRRDGGVGDEDDVDDNGIAGAVTMIDMEGFAFNLEKFISGASSSSSSLHVEKWLNNVNDLVWLDSEDDTDTAIPAIWSPTKLPKLSLSSSSDLEELTAWCKYQEQAIDTLPTLSLNEDSFNNWLQINDLLYSDEENEE